MMPLLSTPAGFARARCLQHLEEASALYEQRLSYLDDPALAWTDLQELVEVRLEAHIDALVVAGGLGLDVCRQQAEQGDAGELYAAVAVYCRQDRLDLVDEALRNLDEGNKEGVEAVGEALNHELPDAWQKVFAGRLAAESAKHRQVFTKLAGYHRLHAGEELIRAAETSPPERLPTVIWSLGRLREQKAGDLLRNNCQLHADTPVGSAAALALLRLGRREILGSYPQSALSTPGVFIAVGLGGGRSAVPSLQALARQKPTPDCLVGLGLLGDPGSMETLLALLSSEDLADAAALSLNYITGAELYEQVFVPEPLDENELFDEEKEKLARGEPLYPPGKEPGTTVTRLTRDPERWRQWWKQNGARFKPQVRYRNGKPYSPGSLLENLQSGKSPRRVRQLAYEEMVVRYNADFPFETDMFVSRQHQALAKYGDWVKANSSRFREGEWYFAGQVVS